MTRSSERVAPQPAARLTFGVFPLGLAGSPDGTASGAPDDYGAIRRAAEDLQGGGPPLLPRMYLVWSGRESTSLVCDQAKQLAASGVRWDLALCYRDRAGDIAAWEALVTRIVREHGELLAAIQVTGEANLAGVPAAADGDFPRAPEALARGVLAAAQAKHESAATAAIGFAVAPEVDPEASGFWAQVGQHGGGALAAALDYAGIDMYPDVFGPRFELEQIPGAVEWVLRSYRERALPIAGIDGSVPIRICESGWPTGPERSEERQAQVLETIIRTVHDLRTELHVTHWGLFTLRDADSAKDDLFHRFGAMRDDYTPKPAYHVLKKLIAELG